MTTSASMLPVIVVPNAAVAKTGIGVSTTYRKVGDTCPPCELLGNGCYAEKGHVAIHQRRAGDASQCLDKLSGAPFIRHEVSGDSFKKSKDGRAILDREYVRAKIDFHNRNSFSIGWGYTHKFSAWDAAGLGPDAWPTNFETLASCHTIKVKDEANAAGWRTARVIDAPGEQTEDEILCPYDLAKHRKRAKKKTCVECRLCWPGQNQLVNIAFIKF